MHMKTRLDRLKMLEDKYPEITKALKIARNVNIITYPLSEDKEVEEAFSNIESLLVEYSSGKQAFKDLLYKEIDDRLESLKIAGNLSEIEALEKATEIVILIIKIIDIGTDNPAELYDKAKISYLIASEKVPEHEKDKVAFPSNFWSMRAKQERTRMSTNYHKLV